MKKEKKSKDFLPTPEYKGGLKSMNEFIQKNLIYPSSALQEKIEGVVVIKGEINHQGKVIHTQIISSLHPDCDKEAQRVVSLLQFQINKIRKVRILFYKTFHIHFKIPVAPEIKIQYELRLAKSTQGENQMDKKIQYTIQFPKK